MVLGLLAGVWVGLACAGIAGTAARRDAVPESPRASQLPDAAILANDAAFDASIRAQIDALPEVTRSYPFLVAFLLETDREGLEGPLVPTAPQTAQPNYGVIVDGRAPGPNRADEVVVNENVRDRFGLHLGSTYALVQEPPADAFRVPVRTAERRVRTDPSSTCTSSASRRPPATISTRRRRVASTPSTKTSSSGSSTSSSTCAAGPGPPRLQNDVERITGTPINVEDAGELFGTRELESVADVERAGLLLFALAVLVGAGTLVGQALVRAVSAGGADLTTWRTLGAVVGSPPALVIPATYHRGGRRDRRCSSIAVAPLAAVPDRAHAPLRARRRRPRGLAGPARRSIGAMVAVVLTAWVTAELRVRRDNARTGRAPTRHAGRR